MISKRDFILRGSCFCEKCSISCGTRCAALCFRNSAPIFIIHPTKTTAAQNEVTLSYHSVHRLYFFAVVFVTNIICAGTMFHCKHFKKYSFFSLLIPIISHHLLPKFEQTVFGWRTFSFSFKFKTLKLNASN